MACIRHRLRDGWKGCRLLRRWARGGAQEKRVQRCVQGDSPALQLPPHSQRQIAAASLDARVHCGNARTRAGEEATVAAFDDGHGAV
mmetsp:Transcript_36659/g.117731  ORF Transcript_36659/g.117731 Transcript_36659/m.117731 type:complete len:87 (-) Transcript_36659:457-717(-)